MNENNEGLTTHKVIFNREEEYSIWPVELETPHDWRDAAKSGSKVDCLTYILEMWTDIRPLSLRKAVEQGGKQSE